MTESLGKTIFVTGTDTGVGKTFICAHLLSFFKGRGINTGYQKWVSTGGADDCADLEYCRQAAGLENDPARLDTMAPYRFRFPASPHLAAELENRAVDPAIIEQSFLAAAAGHELLIVEGVGGLLVPLSRKLLLADLLARFKPLTLLVARSGLGTLNHTLLSLEALRARDIPVLGVVFSDAHEDEDETIVADNIKTVAEMGQVTVFGRMPWVPGDISGSAEYFVPIGEAVLRKIT